MSLLTQNLGYGQTGTIEIDVFTRLMVGNIADTEELRLDVPGTFDNTYSYIGIAESGSNPSDLVWSCIRCSWTNNRKTRIQYRTNMAWSDRAQGWN